MYSVAIRCQSIINHGLQRFTDYINKETQLVIFSSTNPTLLANISSFITCVSYLAPKAEATDLVIKQFVVPVILSFLDSLTSVEVGVPVEKVYCEEAEREDYPRSSVYF